MGVQSVEFVDRPFVAPVQRRDGAVEPERQPNIGRHRGVDGREVEQLDRSPPVEEAREVVVEEQPSGIAFRSKTGGVGEGGKRGLTSPFDMAVTLAQWGRASKGASASSNAGSTSRTRGPSGRHVKWIAVLSRPWAGLSQKSSAATDRTSVTSTRSTRRWRSS